MGIILYGEQKKYDIGAIAIINQKGESTGIINPRNILLGLLEDCNLEEGASKEGIANIALNPDIHVR